MASAVADEASDIHTGSRRRPRPRKPRYQQHTEPDHIGHRHPSSSAIAVHPGGDGVRGHRSSLSPPRPSQVDWAQMDGPLLNSPPRPAPLEGVQSPEPKSQSSPRRQRRKTPSRVSLTASSSNMRVDHSTVPPPVPVPLPIRSSAAPQLHHRALSKDHVWYDDDRFSRSDRDSRQSGSWMVPSVSRGTSSMTSESDSETDVSSQDEQDHPLQAEIRYPDKEVLAERLRTKSKRGGGHRRQPAVEAAIPEEEDLGRNHNRDDATAGRRHRRSPSHQSSDKREHRHAARRSHRKGPSVDDDVRQSPSSSRPSRRHSETDAMERPPGLRKAHTVGGSDVSSQARLCCPTKTCGRPIKNRNIYKSNGREYAKCSYCKCRICTACSCHWHPEPECPTDEQAPMPQVKQADGDCCHNCGLAVRATDRGHTTRCACGEQICTHCGGEPAVCDCAAFFPDAGATDVLEHGQAAPNLRRSERLEAPPPPGDRDAHPGPITAAAPDPAEAFRLRDRDRDHHDLRTYSRGLDENSLPRQLQAQQEASLARRLQPQGQRYDGDEEDDDEDDPEEVHYVVGRPGHQTHEHHRGLVVTASPLGGLTPMAAPQPPQRRPEYYAGYGQREAPPHPPLHARGQPGPPPAVPIPPPANAHHAPRERERERDPQGPNPMAPNPMVASYPRDHPHPPHGHPHVPQHQTPQVHSYPPQYPQGPVHLQAQARPQAQPHQYGPPDVQRQMHHHQSPPGSYSRSQPPPPAPTPPPAVGAPRVEPHRGFEPASPPPPPMGPSRAHVPARAPSPPPAMQEDERSGPGDDYVANVSKARNKRASSLERRLADRFNPDTRSSPGYRMPLVSHPLGPPHAPLHQAVPPPPPQPLPLHHTGVPSSLHPLGPASSIHPATPAMHHHNQVQPPALLQPHTPPRSHHPQMYPYQAPAPHVAAMPLPTRAPAVPAMPLPPMPPPAVPIAPPVGSARRHTLDDELYSSNSRSTRSSDLGPSGARRRHRGDSHDGEGAGAEHGRSPSRRRPRDSTRRHRKEGQPVYLEDELGESSKASLAGLSRPGRGMDRVVEWRDHVPPDASHTIQPQPPKSVIS